MKTFLIVIAVFVLSGCNASLFSYKGATITQPDHMIQLQKGEQQGVWKTNELALNYHYQMTPETLKLSGTVNLLGGFDTGFSSVDRLVVQLLFLDSHGTVLNNVILYSADRDHSIHMVPMNFDRTTPIPADAGAISFAYDGVLVDGGGGDDSTSVSIWNFPR